MINQKTKKEHYVLLCCDGLHGLVPNEEISNTVYEYKAPDVICEKLIEKANESGAPITSLLWLQGQTVLI